MKEIILAIHQISAAQFGVTLEEIHGKSRLPNIVKARHMSMLMIRRHCRLSSVEVGMLFERDHSTVLHGCRRVESDPAMADDLEAVEAKVSALP